MAERLDAASVRDAAAPADGPPPGGPHPGKRDYVLTLSAGAAGAGLVLLAVRQQWARAVFTPPKPLTPQVVEVTGNDLVPLAGALAVAALAGLAAVIATRGAARRVAGVLLALFGAGAGAAVLTSVTAATVLSVAAGKVAAPGAAAVSGAAGSTTSGTTGGGGALVVAGSAGRAIMTGGPWHVAVLAGALLIFAAGLATLLRGPDWPVMSARYDAPAASGAAGGGGTGARGRVRALDSASMWESLNGGEDPTEDPAQDPAHDEPALGLTDMAGGDAGRAVPHGSAAGRSATRE